MSRFGMGPVQEAEPKYDSVWLPVSGKCIKKNCLTDVTYTDFSKAFGSVNYSFLVKKLDQLEFPCGLLKWIWSNLIENSFSSLIRVTSGVPQGSHLGPLLFTLFITDLPLVQTKSRELMYAYDVKLCQQYNERAQILALQSDLYAFQTWCNDN